MSMRMLVDAAHPEETRVAVTRGTRLEAFEFESANKKQLKGNIYLAKVTRVEPSLQAAFVDYGGNRHGFLAFNEIHPDYYQIPVQDRKNLLEEQVDTEDEDQNETAAVETETDEGVESIGGEDELDEDIKRRGRALRQYKIQEVVKRRQIILVQVVKEERGTKGAALTTYLSLAGRYCVLMPNTARGGGISRKIINPSDRKRLKGIATSLDVAEGMGVIIRTAGLNRTKPEIKRDFEYLLRTWNSVRDLTLESSAPCLVHEEGDLIRRGIRDLYNKDIKEILVAGEDGYRSAKSFMKTLMPSQAKVVQPYRENIPLFHKYQVEREIDGMFSPRVDLKSGAYIIINPTEALVAVDVNSGRATKERNIEGTAYRTNLEAAEEIARQIRLRDLAGLIVIDFIDMEVSKNVRAVEAKMKECLKVDRARIQVGRISSFGLMEMSRQRLRPDLVEASTNACRTCGGAGVVRSTESTALAVLRSIEDEGMNETGAVLTIDAPTEVAIYILNQKRSMLRNLEERYDFTLEIRIDEDLIAPDHRIERKKRTDLDGGEKTEDRPVKKAKSEPEATETEDETRSGGRRRRRGRRRRSRRNGDETASVDEVRDDTEEAAAEVSTSDTETKSDVETEVQPTDKPASRRSRRGHRGGRGRSRAATEGVENTKVEDEATSEATNRGAKEENSTPADASLETKAGEAAGDAAGETISDTIGDTVKVEAGDETSGEQDRSATAETEAPAKKPRRASSRPRKTTRRRKKPSDAAPAEKSEDSVAVAVDTDEETPARQSTAPVEGTRSTPEPVLPLAAAADDHAVAPKATEEPVAEKPKRRGWWQRKLT